MAIFASSAWLQDGWKKNTRIVYNADGVFSEVVANTRPQPGDEIVDVVIPAMINLHSHAFQRAMAGFAEVMTHPKDSFWTWRQVMYGFAAQIGPQALQAIAEQLYLEMLEAGYTHVAEFHYVHHQPDGNPYPEPDAMCAALMRAATNTGIGLTLMPVLYMTGGFDGRPLAGTQRRFYHQTDHFLQLLAQLHTLAADQTGLHIGMALHSLRAVPPGPMGDAVAGWRQINPNGPVHIHISEQPAEVADCLTAHGKRPVAWLLDQHVAGPNWCLVHATHIDDGEIRGLAHSGAVAGLCPVTEANLGDGIFPLKKYLAAGGALGIGSDSHVSISPVEELRMLEYSQRLTSGTRNVGSSTQEPHAGARLWRAAVMGGAQAVGRQRAGIQPGARADLLSLDMNNPFFFGREKDYLADSLVFGGWGKGIAATMAGGKWVCRHTNHEKAAAVTAKYRETLAQLLPSRGDHH